MCRSRQPRKHSVGPVSLPSVVWLYTTYRRISIRPGQLLDHLPELISAQRIAAGTVPSWGAKNGGHTPVIPPSRRAAHRRGERSTTTDFKVLQVTFHNPWYPQPQCRSWIFITTTSFLTTISATRGAVPPQ